MAIGAARSDCRRSSLKVSAIGAAKETVVAAAGRARPNREFRGGWILSAIALWRTRRQRGFLFVKAFAGSIETVNSLAFLDLFFKSSLG
jgi:hypothetical protein